MARDIHDRLTTIVDEHFGTRSTMPVDALLDAIERELPALVDDVRVALSRIATAAQAVVDEHDNQTTVCATSYTDSMHCKRCELGRVLRSIEHPAGKHVPTMTPPGDRSG